MVDAGRILPNTSPWARPASSHLEMSVTYVRVRTTSRRLAPAPARARSMFFSVCTACAYTLSAPTILPSSPVATVPATVTNGPTFTAREKPTLGSYGELPLIFCRSIASSFKGEFCHTPGPQCPGVAASDGEQLQGTLWQPSRATAIKLLRQASN